MATVIRPSEFIPERVSTVDDRPVERLTDQVQDLHFRMDELEHQITEQHNQITERDDQIATLWKEHQQQKEELLDWEIRSRIAQALNDEHVQSDRLPKDAYGLLKDRHCDYLPYLLSMWAVYKQRLPAPLLFVDGRAEDKYCAKAQELCDAHLATSIDSIWSSIHDVPRTLMISMWLTRSAYRSSVAHPTPTTVDGMSIIDSDLRLSEPEKFCAKGIIQTAKDKNNNPLFPEL